MYVFNYNISTSSNIENDDISNDDSEIIDGQKTENQSN